MDCKFKNSKPNCSENESLNNEIVYEMMNNQVSDVPQYNSIGVCFQLYLASFISS